MTKEEFDKFTQEANDIASQKPWDDPGNNDWNTVYVRELNKRGLKLIPGKSNNWGLSVTAPLPVQSIVWMYEYPSTIVPIE